MPELTTHNIYKVDKNGRRTFMGSSTQQGATERAQFLGQRPQHQGAQFIVEAKK